MALIQILESGNEAGLKYKAKEEDWTTMLTSAGLIKANDENEDIPSVTLSTYTKGGPDDVDEHKNGEGNAKKEEHSPYFVVSIMGPQSSGKSTILNLLFGCKFQVMDHTQGRKQVTTGIWMGCSPKKNDLLVMDLEGTDAIERKQNRGNFERQTSLMALTLSEALIVNMWACDIGRASGMNVDTLRSILEANLRLFSPNTKTLLLFLIREQSPDETQFGVTPAKVQETTIRGIVDDIWKNIEKPQSYSSTKLSDLFDIHFYFLPPMVFFRDKFQEKVQELYRRFTDPKDPNYYFNTSYHYRKSVPPDGLFTYTTQIWDSISKDESLNIPDQQKLLSSYRCEHAMNEAFKKFLTQSTSIQQNVQHHYVQNFGSSLNDIISKCVHEYNTTANKYDQDEAKEKYSQLVDKIETHIQYLFTYQVKHLISECLEKYEKDIRRKLPKKECVSNFQNIITNIMNQVEKYFREQIATCMINTDNTDLLDAETHTNDLLKRLRDITKSIQSEQLQLLQAENDQLLEEHFTQISKSLRDPSSNVWSKISAARIDYHRNELKTILEKFDNLLYDNIEMKEEKKRVLFENIDQHIISMCKKHTERIETILNEQFDNYFNKEETTGIPRDWNSSMNIKDIFIQSKEKCLKILDGCESLVLEEDKELNLPAIRLRLLKAERINDIRNDFDRSCESKYRNVEDAIRRKEMFYSSIFPSNPITWIIFLFFAWNEIWSMLKNPILLVIFIFAAIIFLIVYQAHALGFNIQAMATSIFRKIFNIIRSQFQELLKSHSETINNYKKAAYEGSSTPGYDRGKSTSQHYSNEDTQNGSYASSKKTK